MFKKLTKKDKRSAIDKEIDRLHEILAEQDPISVRCEEFNSLHDEGDFDVKYASSKVFIGEKYNNVAERLKELYEMRREDAKKIIPIVVAVVGAGATLVEIVMMLNFEKTGTITSKVFGRIPKGRV